MTDDLLTTLTGNTYRKSDFAYRVSLLREFLEFVFFTSHGSSATSEAVDAFATGARPAADVAFLRTLPGAFLGSFSQENFYKSLDMLSEQAKEMPTLTLTLPVVLPSSDLDRIGAWARSEVHPRVMIEFDIDPAIGLGCRVAWRNQLLDFSLDHYFEAASVKLHTALLGRISPSPTAPVLS